MDQFSGVSFQARPTHPATAIAEILQLARNETSPSKTGPQQDRRWIAFSERDGACVAGESRSENAIQCA